MNEQMKKTAQSFVIFGAMLSSCANPTKTIRPEIERFKAEYPDHVVSFFAKSRTVQFAWSGDPKKRPIIFVHGSPGSWEGWSHFLLEPSLQKNFHLIAVDRPGYGESGGGEAETSLAKQAEDILEVLRFNQSHEPAILVGHSFGGPVIARMAIDHPEKITGLVFVASSVDPELEETKWIQYPARWWPIRKLIPTAFRVCNEEIFALKTELIEMLPLWKLITAKSVLIQGGLDYLVPPPNLDFLKKHLPPESILKVVLVEDLNHFVPWKRPDLIKTAIEFLDQKVTKEKQ